ncbi:MAG TPA: hypothetical protein VJM09_09405 [Sphingobium sp.]|nr:hypothetical protein [Sphingobium sp.]
MATTIDDTLKARCAALLAEREQSWTPAQIEANALQRQRLRDRFNPAAVAQPGAVLPPISFTEVDGGIVTLDEITAQGQALIAFVRFADCPAENIAWSHYVRTLVPGLQAGHSVAGAEPAADAPAQGDQAAA